MAVSFPLSANLFFRELPITTLGFQLTDQRASAETRGGELIISESGDRLWEGEVSLDTRETDAVSRFIALTELLGEAGASLLISPEHVNPSASGSPTLAGVRNGNELKLGNLSTGARFTAGDFISFTYGSNPTRYALHQIADFDDAVASGTAGETNYVRVVPHIQPGYTLGVTVKTADPHCKAIMKPGSLRAPTFDGIWAKGWSFSWRQTLR